MQVFGDSFPARVFAMMKSGPGHPFSHGSLRKPATSWTSPSTATASSLSRRQMATRPTCVPPACTSTPSACCLAAVCRCSATADRSPAWRRVEISQDGTISIRALGENPNVVAVVDPDQAESADLKQMEKGTDGPAALQAAARRAGAAVRRANVKVVSVSWKAAT